MARASSFKLIPFLNYVFETENRDVAFEFGAESAAHRVASGAAVILYYGAGSNSVRPPEVRTSAKNLKSCPRVRSFYNTDTLIEKAN